MASLIISALFLITIFSLQSNSVFAQQIEHSKSSSYNLFAGDLLSAIVDQKSNKNVVYSPVSINAILSLIYMGARGNTENELHSVLKLDQNQTKSYVALNYRSFLKTTLNRIKSEDEYNEPPQLSMANSLFISKNIIISEKFKKVAQLFFKSGVKNVDFKDPLAAVQKINGWIEEQTSNNIKNLIEPNAVDNRTSMVLVNAINLDARWLTPFLKYTKKRVFYLNRNETVEVNVMFSPHVYPYVELPELNAKAVELQFQNSDISMLVILPNEVDGLEQVEEKLKGIDLNEIVSNMTNKYLDLFLPKFRFEYEIDLKEPLNKMNCSSMFGSNANLTGIFVDSISRSISKVVHKVYLDCNEKGLKAAGVTYAVSIDRMGGNAKRFQVNHPFFFAVRNKNAVFFAGHVVNPK